eukprot:COSAG02_NODE_3409_length_6790_cov_149.811239_5_plen_473_part_01
MGLKFAPKKQTGAVEVIAINQGTQATRHPQLRPGLILTAVAGTSTAGLSYKRVIDLVRSLPGRPLRCSFSAEGHEGVVAPSKNGVGSRQSLAAPSAERPQPEQMQEAEDRSVVAVFRQHGALGFTLEPRDGAAHTAVVKEILAGSQAAQISNLRAGLAVSSIDDLPVSGFSYAQVVGMIAVASRPVQITCIPAETSPASTSSNPVQAAASAVTVEFLSPGPLGLSFLCEADDRPPRINGVDVAASGGREADLKPGMVLSSIGDTSVRDWTFANCIKAIKSANRPLQLTFEGVTEPTTAAAADTAAKHVEAPAPVSYEQAVAPLDPMREPLGDHTQHNKLVDANVSLELQKQEEVEVATTPTAISSVASRQEVLELAHKEERDVLELLELQPEPEPEPDNCNEEASPAATNTSFFSRSTLAHSAMVATATTPKEVTQRSFQQTFEESGPLGIVWRLVNLGGEEVMMVKSVKPGS